MSISASAHRRGDRIDQVRHGNRRRVLGVDAHRGRIAAERLTDSARGAFDGDYLGEHLVLGYAGTVRWTAAVLRWRRFWTRSGNWVFTD
jgi:hypothetical protein